MTEKFLAVGYFVQYWSRRNNEYLFGRIMEILGNSRWGIETIVLEDKHRQREIVSDRDMIRTCNPDQKPIPMYRRYPFFKNPTLNPRNPMYGFFSREAVEKLGESTAIYLTPSGEEVEVTLVSSSLQPNSCPWDDVICLGEVTQWIRRGKLSRDEIKKETFV